MEVDIICVLSALIFRDSKLRSLKNSFDKREKSAFLRSKRVTVSNTG